MLEHLGAKPMVMVSTMHFLRFPVHWTKFDPKHSFCFWNLVISRWPLSQVSLHKGWIELTHLTSHLALQLLHQEEGRRKRQQEICRNAQQHWRCLMLHSLFAVREVLLYSLAFAQKSLPSLVRAVCACRQRCEDYGVSTSAPLRIAVGRDQALILRVVSSIWSDKLFFSPQPCTNYKPVWFPWELWPFPLGGINLKK